MTTDCCHSTRLDVAYFDGIWRQPHAVQMWIEQGMLQLAGKGVIRQIPLGLVQWPGPSANQGHRVAQLPHRGRVCARDAAGWDAWQQAHQAKLAVHSRAHSIRWAGVAITLLLAVSIWGYGCSWQLSR